MSGVVVWAGAIAVVAIVLKGIFDDRGGVEGLGAPNVAVLVIAGLGSAFVLAIFFGLILSLVYPDWGAKKRSGIPTLPTIDHRERPERDMDRDDDGDDI